MINETNSNLIQTEVQTFNGRKQKHYYSGKFGKKSRNDEKILESENLFKKSD